MGERSDILRRAKELSPWHFDFEILPGVRTTNFNDPADPDPDKRQVESIDSSEILPTIKDYYPSGFSGKDVLDVGCNSGGYCFVAHELGARSVTGIDVRQHWITQAEWIKSIKYPNAGSAVNFQVSDVRTFLAGQDRQFDVVIFKGVLYHLADPIGTLLELCDRTREILLVDTASSDVIPEHCIVPISESTTHVMSGVDGLAWLPGGPSAIRPILEFKGFKSFDVRFWLHAITKAHQGRFRVVASRQLHINGCVDSFTSPAVLSGWAQQEGNDKILEISVLLGETLIGSAYTGLQRSPSVGNIGFSVELSQPITAENILSGAVKVYAVDDMGELHSLPLTTASLLRVSGSVDRFTSPNVLGGWARQPGSEDTLEIRALLDGALIGTSRTGLTRLQPAGNCGFNVTLSEPITLEHIRSNRIKVQAIDLAGNACELAVWPKLLDQP